MAGVHSKREHGRPPPSSSSSRGESGQSLGETAPNCEKVRENGDCNAKRDEINYGISQRRAMGRVTRVNDNTCVSARRDGVGY